MKAEKDNCIFTWCIRKGFINKIKKKIRRDMFKEKRKILAKAHETVSQSENDMAKLCVKIRY
jgi:hypothetical protein